MIQELDKSKVTEDFRAAMKSAGIDYGGEIQTGKLTRFNAVGERNQASWYVLYLDGVIPAGKFGCHRRDISVDYKYQNGSGEKLSKEEWSAAAKKIKDAEIAKKTDAEQRLTEAKAATFRLLSAAKVPVQEHDYLKRKRVGIYGEVRQDEEGCLLLPLRDIDGTLFSMQFIAPDKRFGWNDNRRDKDFIPGGRIKGCFYTVSDLTEGPLVICEGYATGASIYEATGYATVCAMFCGNLLDVAKEFRTRYPQRPIIVGADNDRNTKGNPGRTKAEEACKSINGALACPSFAAVDDPKATDFNDFKSRYGTDKTAEIINVALQGLYSAVGNKGLPPLDNASGMMADATIQLPPEIIKGLLHQGLKGVLGSNSKARKSWLLLDLAISVATGTNFWRWETVKGRVLYINFEIPRPFIRSRIAAVVRAKGVSAPDTLDIWTLRGFAGPLEKLLPEIMKQVKIGKYILIVIDPIYKTLGDRDENAAGDVANLCNEIEKLAVESGAAVIYGAHFSKGNQAAKEAIDRIGGSGVWTRDADTIVILTKHKDEDCFTVDMILRNLPEAKPFVVKWEYPIMVAQPELDPEELKQPKSFKDNGRGRPATYDEKELIGLIPGTGIYNADWIKLANSEFGISKSQFFRMRKDLELKKKIEKNAAGDWRLVGSDSENADSDGIPSSAPRERDFDGEIPLPNEQNENENSNNGQSEFDTGDDKAQ